MTGLGRLSGPTWAAMSTGAPLTPPGPRTATSWRPSPGGLGAAPVVLLERLHPKGVGRPLLGTGRRGPSGGDGGEQRHLVLASGPADVGAIGPGPPPAGRVDHQLDLPGADELDRVHRRPPRLPPLGVSQCPLVAATLATTVPTGTPAADR